jgi:uncharacterized membrane protein YqjE
VDNRGSQTSGTLYADERSISEVLKDIGGSIQHIVRSEIRLARIEIAESVRRARSSMLSLATGGVLTIYGLGFLMLAAMFALDIALPAWLSALIIGLLALIGGSIGIFRGRGRLKEIRPPHKTIETVKEDLQWMKEQPKS